MKNCVFALSLLALLSATTKGQSQDVPQSPPLKGDVYSISTDGGDSSQKAILSGFYIISASKEDHPELAKGKNGDGNYDHLLSELITNSLVLKNEAAPPMTIKSPNYLELIGVTIDYSPFKNIGGAYEIHSRNNRIGNGKNYSLFSDLEIEGLKGKSFLKYKNNTYDLGNADIKKCSKLGAAIDASFSSGKLVVSEVECTPTKTQAYKFRDAQFLAQNGEGQIQIYISSLMLPIEERESFEAAIDRIHERISNDPYETQFKWAPCSHKVRKEYLEYEAARDSAWEEGIDPTEQLKRTELKLQNFAEARTQLKTCLLALGKEKK